MKTKGLEPIVAAVLLIVVAVIGAVLVYLWFAGFVTKATSQAEQASASEKLKIEAATLNSNTPPNVILYVRNLGGSDVEIVSAYVLLPGSLTPVCYTAVTTGNIIYANSLGYLDINLGSCTFTAGREYVVKLVTAKGTEFAVTVTAS